MNKFRTSAIEILKKNKTPLHYKEITRLALEAGILETEGATPDASMNSQIIIDIRNKGEKSDFVKVAPSTYKLNPKRTDNVKEDKIIERENIDQFPINIDPAFAHYHEQIAIKNKL